MPAPDALPIDYLLDTNVVIHALLGRILDILCDDRFYGVSAITKIELLGTTSISATDEVRRRAFIGDMQVMPVSPEVVDHAIELRRRYPLKVPDAIIAATALHYKAILLTNDGELLRALGPMAQPVPLVAAP
mgnify:CR=1 FL=1